MRVSRLTQAIREPDAELQVEPTPEFAEANAALGKARDAFREGNARDFGPDVPTAMGALMGVEEGRNHAVLLLDRLPGAAAGARLSHMRAVASARVMLHGDSGALTDMLTAHPAVECVLEFDEWGVEDDFHML